MPQFPPKPRPPSVLALQAYRRMALRAASPAVLERLASVLIDEIYERDRRLRELGDEPVPLYDTDEVAMLVKGCKVMEPGDEVDNQT